MNKTLHIQNMENLILHTLRIESLSMQPIAQESFSFEVKRSGCAAYHYESGLLSILMSYFLGWS